MNTPYNPRTLFGALAVAGRMSIHGHAALASRRHPWRRSHSDEYQLRLFEIIDSPVNNGQL